MAASTVHPIVPQVIKRSNPEPSASSVRSRLVKYISATMNMTPRSVICQRKNGLRVPNIILYQLA